MMNVEQAVPETSDGKKVLAILAVVFGFIAPTGTVVGWLYADAGNRAAIANTIKQQGEQIVDLNTRIVQLQGDLKQAIAEINAATATRVATYGPQLSAAIDANRIQDERIGNMIDANARRDTKLDKLTELANAQAVTQATFTAKLDAILERLPRSTSRP